MQTVETTTSNPNSTNAVLAADVFQFTVKVRRNYYGEIQEEERVIEGEDYKRAKFKFNNRHIDWYVVDACR